MIPRVLQAMLCALPLLGGFSSAARAQDFSYYLHITRTTENAGQNGTPRADWVSLFDVSSPIYSARPFNTNFIFGVSFDKFLDSTSLPCLEFALTPGLDAQLDDVMLDGTNATPGATNLIGFRLQIPAVLITGATVTGGLETPVEHYDLQILGQYTCHYYYADAAGNPLAEHPFYLDYTTATGSADYPVFNCNATFTPGSTTASVTWPAFAGISYQIQSSPAPSGPFTTVGSLTPTLSGPASVNVNLTGNPAFLRVVHFFP